MLHTKVSVKKFLQELACAGLTPNLCRRHQETIRRANLRLARVISAGATVVLAVLLGFSFFAESISTLKLLYLFFLVVMLAFAINGLYSNHVSIYLYLVVCCIYLFGVLLGAAVQTDQNAVIFCVFLVVMPQLIVDAPWRSILPELAFECLFLILSARNCAPEVASINAVNSLSCLFIGLVLTHHTAANHARQFALLDQLCGQRDTDALTGLVTRRAAEEQIRQLLDFGGEPFAMLMCDVDNFKHINDTYGHAQGDVALQNVAALLQRCARSSDLVARMGGDEFLLMMFGLDDPNAACLRAQELLDALAATPALENTDHHLSLSIGIVLSPRDGTIFEELYHRADHAMYIAKRSGKNRYSLFGT
jgi:diguanylate cyclase (GGDEF)-like protein